MGLISAATNWMYFKIKKHPIFAENQENLSKLPI